MYSINKSSCDSDVIHSLKASVEAKSFMACSISRAKERGCLGFAGPRLGSNFSLLKTRNKMKRYEK